MTWCPSSIEKLQKHRGLEMRAKPSMSHDESVEGKGAGTMPGPELATTSATAQNSQRERTDREEREW